MANGRHSRRLSIRRIFTLLSATKSVSITGGANPDSSSAVAARLGPLLVWHFISKKQGILGKTVRYGMVCDGDLGLGDFTGDGVAEAVAVCGGHVNPFRADSRGRFDTLASRLTIPIQDPDFVRVGDLKNDEDPDIIVNRDWL